MALGEFPHLRDEFEEFAGLPYVQMGTFARLVQEAKGRADWDMYARAASFAHRLWLDADSDLRNAINVSLLEHIDFEGPRGPHAWSLLSPQLQRAWRAMAAYNNWLHSGAKGEPPPEAGV
jgi:hypothetical protein